MTSASRQPPTTAARLGAGRSLSRLRSGGYVRRWLVLGALIGVVAGLGAVVFSDGLDLATRLLLTDVGGYTPAGTIGDGGAAVASGFSRPWAIPLVVAAGGLVSGLLVFGLAPEAEGHGTDAAIRSVHTNPKGVRPRVIGVKLIASMITIGSGGSGGREGPTAQISSGFGSVLARVLNLTPSDARIAVSAGIASGIGAIFRAPLGGALLGAELIYRDDVEIEALIPSIVASIIGYAVFAAITGDVNPLFGYHDSYRIHHVWELSLFVLVGVVCGLAGRLYVVVFYKCTDLFTTWQIPRWIKPGLAGAAVGVIGLAVPGVLGTGYGQLQHDLDVHQLLSMPWWVVLAVPFAKVAGTGLSIGSGGSGGVFGPGLVIGGSTAALLWRLLHLVGLGTHNEVAFVIVGMMACFGSIAHAPLSVVLMVAEMTGNLTLLPAAMIAIAFAVAVVGDTTIYRSQLRRRSDSAAHRFSLGLPASSSVAVTDIMVPPRLVLDGTTPVGDALRQLTEAGLPGAPVVNDDLGFIGSVQTPALADLVDRGGAGTVGRVADVEAMTIPTDAALDAATEALPASKGGWVPVLDDHMRVVGVIATSDLVRGWRLAVNHWLRHIAGAASETMVEITVGRQATVAGRRIDQLRLPAGTVVISMFRAGSIISPKAGDEVLSGDVVTAVVRPGQEGNLRRMLADDDGQRDGDGQREGDGQR